MLYKNKNKAKSARKMAFFITITFSLRNAPALEHHGPDGEILLVQHHEAGVLALVQRAAAVGNADGLCRGQRFRGQGRMGADGYLCLR